MATTKKKSCSTCKHFTNECSGGEGVCEAPLPISLLRYYREIVTCSDGSTCNAWVSRGDVLDRVKEVCDHTIKKVDAHLKKGGNSIAMVGKVLALDILEIIDQQENMK